MLYYETNSKSHRLLAKIHNLILPNGKHKIFFILAFSQLLLQYRSDIFVSKLIKQSGNLNKKLFRPYETITKNMFALRDHSLIHKYIVFELVTLGATCKKHFTIIWYYFDDPINTKFAHSLHVHICMHLALCVYKPENPHWLYEQKATKIFQPK